ncbi:hypothetical protein [Aliidiomarina indica]|uniref:hypothetical protein n=1 Tax=Aliidiomarina indica TaxID=2749147 RepID=UPI00188F1D8B|nr:hypothetical protein [Aliidiomarina indica]
MSDQNLHELSNEEIIIAMHKILESPYQNWLSTWGKNVVFNRYKEELYRRGYAGEIPEWRYGPK